MINNLKRDISRNISNIPGWSTKRKIVVIESDDWGSIRMSSKQAFNRLLKAGIPVDKSHYNLYDSLESNLDLEILFETISNLQDSTGRTPVISGINIVANPNFDRIMEDKYTEYNYEPFTETLKRYPKHDKVYDLLKEGIEKRLFIPLFHGREHLNVKRWMNALQNKNKSTILGFENKVTGIPKNGINNELVPNFQAAFDIDSEIDLDYQKIILKEGFELFEKLYNYKSKYFVPTNGPFNNSLELDLYNHGVEFINTAKKQREPLGNGKFKLNTRFIGDMNKFNQTYITRNCFFEPSSTEYNKSIDWVANCLNEIEIAFRWHKPAIISSHRVNYIGYLHPENRESGLKQFRELLSKMLNKWPDIEFMTSIELGVLISESKSKNI